MSLIRVRHHKHRRGATLILVALLMLFLVGLVAFGVEVGRMYLVRSQMQTAVDAGALAAAYTLRQDREDVEGAVAAAREFVRLNRVGWLVTVPEDAISVEPGMWDRETRTFTAGGEEPQVVRVAGQQSDEPLFFGRVFGRRTFAVPESAIANIGGSRMDIIMTLDLSGSMGSNGRIDALQTAAPEFVNVIEEVGDDDRIGVFGYGAIPAQYNPLDQGHNGIPYLNAPVALYPANSNWTGVLEAPLTDDFDYLRNNVLNSATLTANKYNGWTPIGAALRDSAHYLNTNAREGVEKVIVLMSDGHANKPAGNGPGYALSMAEYANSLDIKVYTISLGNSADEQLMEDIATATGAQYVDATGHGQAELTEKLTEAFRHVAGALKNAHLVD